MSSGTPYDPNAGATATLAGAAYLKFDDAMKSMGRLGISPRQMELNRLWSWYKTKQYESRRFDWNGQQVTSPLEREAIGSQGFTPPGMTGSNGDWPLKYRRPSVQYHLSRVIVNRFSGMLFSERHHPAPTVDGDPNTDDFLKAMFDQGRLWAKMVLARQYGGSMGTTCLGFQFKDGKVCIDAHDPRWMTPLAWADRSNLELDAVEKKYIYSENQRDDNGKWVDVAYWYRRIITSTEDILFEPCLVTEEDEEPQWVVADAVQHSFGFCPVQWMQNLPVEEDIDGECDVEGLHEMFEATDGLLSQSHRATLANCDPTLLLKTKGDIPSTLKKGSENALKTEPEGDARYLEMTGSGIKMAREQAAELRTFALEVAQCTLDHPDSQTRTATEIELVYSSMISKTDVLREQYGEKGIKPFGIKMLRAARHIGTPRIVMPTATSSHQKWVDKAHGTPPKAGQDQGAGGGNADKWEQAAGGAQGGAGGAGAEKWASHAAGDRGGAGGAAGGAEKWAAHAGGGAGGGTSGGNAEKWAAQAGSPPPGSPPVDGASPAPGTMPSVQRGVLKLPPKITKDPNGAVLRIPRKLGTNPDDDEISLTWPVYFEPTLPDAQAAATAASLALTSKLIDDEAAVKFIAPYFKIEDPMELLDRLRGSAAQDQADQMAMMQSAAAQQQPPGAPGQPPPTPGAAPPGGPPQPGAPPSGAPPQGAPQ